MGTQGAWRSVIGDIPLDGQRAFMEAAQIGARNTPSNCRNPIHDWQLPLILRPALVTFSQY
jgi:hypothetical protein